MQLDGQGPSRTIRTGSVCFLNVCGEFTLKMGNLSVCLHLRVEQVNVVFINCVKSDVKRLTHESIRYHHSHIILYVYIDD